MRSNIIRWHSSWKLKVNIVGVCRYSNYYYHRRCCGGSLQKSMIVTIMVAIVAINERYHHRCQRGGLLTLLLVVLFQPLPSRLKYLRAWLMLQALLKSCSVNELRAVHGRLTPRTPSSHCRKADLFAEILRHVDNDESCNADVCKHA